MARKMVDCRQLPNDIGCTLMMAGEPEELLDAAVRHATDKHGHQDTAELREQLRGVLVDAEPAMAWTEMPVAGVLPALGCCGATPSARGTPASRNDRLGALESRVGAGGRA